MDSALDKESDPSLEVGDTGGVGSQIGLDQCHLLIKNSSANAVDLTGAPSNL